MKIHYDADVSLDILTQGKIAVIGYGSQGHAHALNLRDSGLNVIVGQRPGGKNYYRALEHGFNPVSADDAAKEADLIAILVQDQYQPEQFLQFQKFPVMSH